MPFESEKQRKFMWAKHPDIARKWTAKYGSTPKRERPSLQGLKHATRKTRAKS